MTRAIPSSVPKIAYLTVVREGQAQQAQALGEQLAVLGDQVRWVCIDLTREGFWTAPGALLVRPPSLSEAQGLKQAAEASGAQWIGLAPPGVRWPAGQQEALEQGLAGAQDQPLILGDLLLDSGPLGVDEYLEIGRCLGQPPGGFEQALLVRRETFLGLDLRHGSPWKLELWQRYREEALYLQRPLAQLSFETFEQAGLQNTLDAELFAAWQAPEAARHELTVLLASHQRRDLLVECLERFARQPLPRGSFDIVVIDDGSTDGTQSMLEALQLPVELTWQSVPQGGAAAARVAGLPLARGELLVFVNDDTLPFTNTLKAHLAAHRLHAPKQVSILGTFEQAPEHLNTPLMRYLERTNHVFGYPDFKPGEIIQGRNYYTCNVSTPRAALEAIGGFDPEFRMLAEDTDLGVRLELAGIPLIYRPEVRSIHHHKLTYADIRRRQPTVARAHARLIKKHPWLLREFTGWQTLTRVGLAGYLRLAAGAKDTCERQLATLADLDLSALEALGPEEAALIPEIEAEFAAVFPQISGLWWSEGFVEGFTQVGLGGFLELAEQLEQGATKCTIA